MLNRLRGKTVTLKKAMIEKLFLLILKFFNKFNNLIVKFTLLFACSNPSPHKFYSIPLQSTMGDSNKSIPELLSERKNKFNEFKENLDEFNNVKTNLKNLKKAIDLDSVLPDKTKNWEMKQIMKFYEHFFDEDSGNTREEGIKQLNGYLWDEHKTYKNKLDTLKTRIQDIEKEVRSRKELKPDNTSVIDKNQIIYPLIPIFIHIRFLIQILFTILSVSITLNLIDLNIIDYIHWILDLDIFTLYNIYIHPYVFIIALLLWEVYRIYNKTIKYYRIIKYIYIFSKKKYYYLSIKLDMLCGKLYTLIKKFFK